MSGERDINIKFSPLDEELIERLSSSLDSSELDCEYLREALFSFLSFEGVAVCLFSGFLLVRVYSEGEYSFVYPIALADGLDTTVALFALADYARRELIPFVITDLPREELSTVSSAFPSIDAAAYEDDEDSFCVRVHNECSRLSEFPTAHHLGVTLSPFRKSEAEEYSLLAKDKEVNRYWGYDLTEDMPNATGEEIFSVVEREFKQGVALSLAVRCEGELVGEAVLYDFDFRHGCEAAVRLKASAQGRGIGTRAFRALIDLAREIGVKNLSARVKKENTPSIAMMDKLMPRVCEKDGTVYYKRAL